MTLIADPVDQLLADRSICEQSHQLLELMKKNVHILLRLVNQILDFRKVENGRMELHLEPFDLLNSFEGWNDSFRVALLKRHIAFSFEPASGVDYRMLADAEKMERIYFNLLSNAVKYTQENGKIVVRLEAEDRHFRLSVFNSGSYISTTDVEAIFERFYQVGGHQAGTGIGLAWCVLLWKCMAVISWRTAMRKELLSPSLSRNGMCRSIIPPYRLACR